MDLNRSLIETKNLVSDSGVNAILVQVNFDIVLGVKRFAANVRDDIVWNGYTWTAFPIQFKGQSESDDNQLPTLAARICNIASDSGSVMSYLEQYNGAVGESVIIYFVHTDHLAETSNIPTFKWYIKSTYPVNRMWATFNLSIGKNPYNQADPKDTMLKNFCRYDFPNSEDSRCPYTGAVSTCDRTLATCYTLNGSDSFKYGGFPGIGRNRIYV